jgi:glycogen debranching enzyme
MLRYAAELHVRSTHPAGGPFPYPWEDIGPGYCYNPAFGHYDLIHQVLDVLPTEPEHARNQLLNNLANQQPDGLVPGTIWMGTPEGEWNTETGHPPVWLVAVQDWCDEHSDTSLIRECFEPLTRQIGWFETKRRAEGDGFFYTPIHWEDGIDEGVRFDNVASMGNGACVDATAHVFWAYQHAADWATLVGQDSEPYARKAAGLRRFIQERLFDDETGFFHDAWAVGRPEQRPLAFEGMFPVVVGAASPEQAARVIDENLLSRKRFFTKHPITTVALNDPLFEMRMWRGPAWNSMTYWAARGCMRYGRHDAARSLLEAALDDTAEKFAATGTIWEFYHPHGGPQCELQRKPDGQYNAPCRDYLGHNPVMAMARLWETVT